MFPFLRFIFAKKVSWDDFLMLAEEGGYQSLTARYTPRQVNHGGVGCFVDLAPSSSLNGFSEHDFSMDFGDKVVRFSYATPVYCAHEVREGRVLDDLVQFDNRVQQLAAITEREDKTKKGDLSVVMLGEKCRLDEYVTRMGENLERDNTWVK